MDVQISNTLDAYLKLRSQFENDQNNLIELDKFVNKKEAIYSGNNLIGMDDGLPIYTKLVENICDNNKILLYENDEFIFILNEKSPYEELEKESCAMSFIHFIGIPKRRIYNIVTIENDDLNLIKNMKEIAIKYFENNKNKILREIFNLIYCKIKKLNISDTLKLDINMRLQFDTSITINSSGKDLEFTVNPHPYNDIGHLYMNCYLNTTRTNMVNDWKNLSVDIILNTFLQNPEPEKINISSINVCNSGNNNSDKYKYNNRMYIIRREKETNKKYIISMKNKIYIE